MVIIQVTGLPKVAKMPSLIFLFRNILKGAVDRFWIKDVLKSGKHGKKAIVEVTSYDAAYTFERIFDGYAFGYGPGPVSILSAEIVSEDSLQQSSAHSHNDSGKGMKSSFSPQDRGTNKFKKPNVSIAKTYPGFPTPPPGTPHFLRPCKMLVRNMKSIIDAKADNFEKKLLTELIRCEIRMRLSRLLENLDHTPSVQIVKMYRQINPKYTDEEIVVNSLELLRASHWLDIKKNDPKPQRQNQTGIQKTNTNFQAKTENTGSTSNEGIVKTENSDKTMLIDSEVPKDSKMQVKNEQEETTSTAALELLEAADDDWVEDAEEWDINENSGDGSAH